MIPTIQTSSVHLSSRAAERSGLSPHRPTPGFTIIYVLGAGHSGTTLLNLLLNGHSQVVGLCELDSLNERLSLPPDDPLFPLTSPFWQRITTIWRDVSGRSFHQISLETPPRRKERRWSRSDRDAFVAENEMLFYCIERISGASFVVDTSRSRRRLELLRRNPRWTIKVIHLVRDGRGVINSYRRKYGRFRIGLRRWMLPTLFGLLSRRRMRDLDWMTVRYERLATSPESVLGEICRFVGIGYEEGMLAYWEAEDVSIGGNRMRLSKAPARLDERWRSELSPIDRLLFLLTGAWLNRLCGYPVFGAYEPDRPVATRSS